MAANTRMSAKSNPPAISPQTEPARRPALPRDRRTFPVEHRVPLLMGVLSGLLLWAAFPPLRLSPLTVAAVAVLAIASVRAKSQLATAFAGLAGGTLFGLLSVWWLAIAHPTGYIGWVGLSLYLGVYWSITGLLIRSSSALLPALLPLSVAVVWVGMEFVRSWMLGGFPWFYLAHPFYRWPLLIQGCAVLGTYGLSLLIAWTGGLAAFLALRPIPLRSIRTAMHVVALGVIWIAWLVYGHMALRTADSSLTQGPRLLLIQTNVPQSLRERTDQTEELHARFLHLAGTSGTMEADLVVWPETTWRHIWPEIDPALTDEQARRIIGHDVETLRAIAARVRHDLTMLARSSRAPVVMGLNMLYIGPDGSRLYNSALVLTPRGPEYPPYHKIHLLPFGEYVPLEDWLPVLRIFSPNTQSGGSLTPGDEPVVFEIAGCRLGPLICFEDTVPALARRAVRDLGADVLLNLTNDGWFGRSPEHEVHLAAALFRSVECRRTLVRAVNTGISAVIDPYGRIIAVAGGSIENAVWREDLVAASVPLTEEMSPYCRWVGDSPGWLCQWLILVLAVFSLPPLRGRLARNGELCTECGPS